MVRIVYIEALTQTTDYSWEGINLVKWSMVEPAIGITAAAIATLRPLFSTFLLRKRPGHSHDDDSDDRKLAESRQAVTPNARDGESYGFEFAEMLGLKRVGVTTVISAQGGDRSWKARLRNPLHRTDFFASSQIELNDGASQEELTAPDWNAGITKTTVITIDQ